MAYWATQRFARPKTFLYLMTLRTGTELICLTLVFNKLTGVYGILALFTGYTLSSLQLTHYIYSIAALVLSLVLIPHIRRQSPFQCLALAWFYVLDSLINVLYTIAFGLAWFFVLARHTAPLGDDAAGIPGSGTIDDTSGFTNPKFNVSRVDVVQPTSTSDKTSSIELIGHEDALAAAANDGVNGNVLGSTILQSGGMASLTVITALWVIRIYFIFIMLAYARGVLRQSIISTGQPTGLASTDTDGNGDKVVYLENPFTNMGGWMGRLGRAMVAWPKNYWLGPDAYGENGLGVWERQVGSRMGKSGVQERERRRRTGTGPPILKPIELGSVSK